MWGQAKDLCRITLLCLCSYFARFLRIARQHHINWALLRSSVSASFGFNSSYKVTPSCSHQKKSKTFAVRLYGWASNAESWPASPRDFDQFGLLYWVYFSFPVVMQWKNASILPLGQLFSAEYTILNVSQTQIIRNPNYLFLNPSQRIQSLGDRLLGSSWYWGKRFCVQHGHLSDSFSIQRLQWFWTSLHVSGR